MNLQDRQPSGSGPAFLVTLFLSTGAGVGQAFAELTPGVTHEAILPLAAAIAAGGAALLAIVWRWRKVGTHTSLETTKEDALASTPAVAPEPVRNADPCADLITLEGPIIDDDTIAGLRKLGGDEFVEEVSKQFVAEGVLVLFKVAQAITELNAAEYGSQVHALRSSAANVGARRLYKLCLEWRELDAAELADTGSARFVQLQREFSAAERALKDLHGQGARELSAATVAG